MTMDHGYCRGTDSMIGRRWSIVGGVRPQHLPHVLKRFYGCAAGEHVDDVCGDVTAGIYLQGILDPNFTIRQRTN